MIEMDRRIKHVICQAVVFFQEILIIHYTSYLLVDCMRQRGMFHKHNYEYQRSKYAPLSGSKL